MFPFCSMVASNIMIDPRAYSVKYLRERQTRASQMIGLPLWPSCSLPRSQFQLRFRSIGRRNCPITLARPLPSDGRRPLNKAG
jgi:hypothetical protein